MKVRVAPRASREIDEILDHLASQSRAAMVGFAIRLDEVLLTLSEYPLSGRKTNRRHMRTAITAPYPYLIFYRVLSGEIVAVRHGARNPKSMPARPRRP